MRLIIIIVAMVIALLVAFVASDVLNEKEEDNRSTVLTTAPSPEPAKVPETEIYIARRDIPIGTSITEDDYDRRAWPTHLLPPNPIVVSNEGIAVVKGQIASAPIVEGEPMMASKLRNPNDPSFLAGQLPEGMRAVTISMNLTDSVAGFVAPGDMVDILFTFELERGVIDTGDLTATGGEEEQRVAISEVMLPNVKVLAVDRRVTNAAGKDGAQPPVPASVTLAVNQRDAQKLKLGEKIGRLSLVLRSLEDKDQYDIPRPSAEQDLTRLLPPAYFPALFDSDAAYDYNVVDLYGNARKKAQEETNEEDTLGVEEEPEDPYMNVNIYRGVSLETVEVNRQ